MKFLLSVVILSIALLSCGENVGEDNIPQDIKESFEQRFPDASEVKWSQDLEGYEVDFIINGNKMEVTYAEDGSVVRVLGDESEPQIKPIKPDPTSMPEESEPEVIEKDNSTNDIE